MNNTQKNQRKTVFVCGVAIGSGIPKIQSMTNTPTKDVSATLGQIGSLASLGCQLARVSVPDEFSVRALPEIVRNSPIPVIADIHFDYKLALRSIDAGVAKLRINPGNIGGNERTAEVLRHAKSAGVPVRIGVNGGSLDADIAEKYGRGAAGLCESAKRCAAFCEENGFSDLVISVKSSSVRETAQAYRLVHKALPYPLHVGLTEAGAGQMGIMKSAVAIGSLLLDGIGDTLRVSLTDAPENEVIAGKNLLRAVGMDNGYCEIIACPTCARTECDLIGLYRKVSELTKDTKKPHKIAVMGCVVNGPGEASACELGIAGGKDRSVIFKNGVKVETCANDRLFERFSEYYAELTADD